MKFFKSLLLSLLIISLVGCGNSANNTTKTSNSDLNSNTQTSTNTNVKKDLDESSNESVKEKDIEEEKITKLESTDNIDVSNITYKTSETEKDVKLEKAIRKFYDIKPDEEIDSRYYYNKVDLNGDDKPEIFVYLVGSYFCGTGGCSAVIFESTEDEYKLISNFTIVNSPVVISENKTNGWNDIIMNVYGGGAESFYAQMKFDGKKYPLNPSMQPAFEGTEMKGTAIIANDITVNNGIKF